jgi:hypothetical protein
MKCYSACYVSINHTAPSFRDSGRHCSRLMGGTEIC